MAKVLLLLSILLLAMPSSGYGQNNATTEVEPPAILSARSEEDYTLLKDNDSIKFFLKELKYISLNKSRRSFLTIGGEYRARLNYTRNIDFSNREETAYLQRLNLHTAFNFGKRLRLFAEFYHGYSSVGEVTLQSDHLDIHQAFLDWKIVHNEKNTIKLRLGRQEMGYGSSRIVGIRNGPNLRRSFDMARLRLQRQKSQLDLFYGKEVSLSPQAFDNTSSIFNSGGLEPSFWGAYFRKPLHKELRMIEFYYFGFHSNFSAFNDGQGEERRHSIGLRSFGAFGRFTYNTEFIFQLGEISDQRIVAYNLEADWKYRLSDTGWKPKVGLKFDWSSGDKNMGDGKIGTFNPIFVNPGIYSLASVNTPVNLSSLHPNVTFYPFDKLTVYLDYAFFYRTRAADGFYSPPRFLSRPASEQRARYLGQTFGAKLTYTINRNLSADLITYYFITGDFIEATGDAQNIFFIAPTFHFKF